LVAQRRAGAVAHYACVQTFLVLARSEHRCHADALKTNRSTLKVIYWSMFVKRILSIG
jgi:hypothetical protein